MDSKNRSLDFLCISRGSQSVRAQHGMATTSALEQENRFFPGDVITLKAKAGAFGSITRVNWLPDSDGMNFVKLQLHLGPFCLCSYPRWNVLK